MNNIDSYFDSLGDAYLYDNLILQRDAAGDGYYIEQITENIVRQPDHPTFNQGPTFTPSLEEQLESEHRARPPKSACERERDQQRSQRRLNHARITNGRGSRPYDDAADSLQDSFGMMERRGQAYGSGFRQNQRPKRTPATFGNRM